MLSALGLGAVSSFSDRASRTPERRLQNSTVWSPGQPITFPSNQIPAPSVAALFNLYGPILMALNMTHCPSFTFLNASFNDLVANSYNASCLSETEATTIKCGAGATACVLNPLAFCVPAGATRCPSPTWSCPVPCAQVSFSSTSIGTKTSIQVVCAGTCTSGAPFSWWSSPYAIAGIAMSTPIACFLSLGFLGMVCAWREVRSVETEIARGDSFIESKSDVQVSSYCSDEFEHVLTFAMALSVDLLLQPAYLKDAWFTIAGLIAGSAGWTCVVLPVGLMVKRLQLLPPEQEPYKAWNIFMDLKRSSKFLLIYHVGVFAVMLYLCYDYLSQGVKQDQNGQILWNNTFWALGILFHFSLLTSNLAGRGMQDELHFWFRLIQASWEGPVHSARKTARTVDKRGVVQHFQLCRVSKWMILTRMLTSSLVNGMGFLFILFATPLIMAQSADPFTFLQNAVAITFVLSVDDMEEEELRLLFGEKELEAFQEDPDKVFDSFDDSKKELQELKQQIESARQDLLKRLKGLRHRRLARPSRLRRRKKAKHLQDKHTNVENVGGDEDACQQFDENEYDEDEYQQQDASAMPPQGDVILDVAGPWEALRESACVSEVDQAQIIEPRPPGSPELPGALPGSPMRREDDLQEKEEV